MANSNYPQELIALVEEYLTDGIISTKERQVLLKKAQQLGVDVDEFDLYIDAQQQKVDQAAEAAASKRRGKTCPFCGAAVPMLTDKCPSCGKTISPEASQELQEIFDKLEEALVDFKSGKDIEKNKALVERYVRKAKMYYENNPKVQKLLTEVQEESQKTFALAKKAARNKTIVRAITNHKKLTAFLIFLVLVGISEVWSLIKGKDMKDDAQATIEAMNTAIDAGELSKAIDYYSAYKDSHYKISELKTSANKLAKALIKAGDYDAALGMLNKEKAQYADDINWMIQDELIKVGDYQNAEACVVWNLPSDSAGWVEVADKYYNFLCKCIDQMNNNGDSESQIKSFVDRKTSRYDEANSEVDWKWKRPQVQNRLYEYAGISLPQKIE